MQKLLTFFSAKNISVYAKFNDQSFNDTLTNDIVSFEQLGPDSTDVHADLSHRWARMHRIFWSPAQMYVYIFNSFVDYSNMVSLGLFIHQDLALLEQFLFWIYVFTNIISFWQPYISSACAKC